MNLIAHLTLNEGLILATVFSLGFGAGAGLTWLVGLRWFARNH